MQAETPVYPNERVQIEPARCISARTFDSRRRRGIARRRHSATEMSSRLSSPSSHMTPAHGLVELVVLDLELLEPSTVDLAAFSGRKVSCSWPPLADAAVCGPDSQDIQPATGLTLPAPRMWRSDESVLRPQSPPPLVKSLLPRTFASTLEASVDSFAKCGNGHASAADHTIVEMRGRCRR